MPSAQRTARGRAEFARLGRRSAWSLIAYPEVTQGEGEDFALKQGLLGVQVPVELPRDPPGRGLSARTRRAAVDTSGGDFLTGVGAGGRYRWRPSPLCSARGSFPSWTTRPRGVQDGAPGPREPVAGGGVQAATSGGPLDHGGGHRAKVA
eukprot:CAMPEP_0175723158 /NCGR_PEP_ID=MMETSP0097-20121207/46593_1 /TAXON_ID=311494 /ORGANISM="Alexandrium monilatum, Strain CCMP3105" /LENGTH=149 /DNA_ID=CAMNT_0017030879 /DNA_START=27 /DNA_END=474 /DNA_ORIENTATION=+